MSYAVLACNPQISVAYILVDWGLCSASCPSGTQAEGAVTVLNVASTGTEGKRAGQIVHCFLKLLSVIFVHISGAKASHMPNPYFKGMENRKSTMCLPGEPEIFGGQH